MRKGRAEENADPLTSVRVEVDESGSGAPAPELVTAPPSGSGSAKALVALVGVALAVVLGVLLYRLAPESGRAADGSPITVPTSEPPVPSTTDGPPPQTRPSTTSVDEVSEPFDGLDDFESADVEAFFFEIIEGDLGWFALASEFDVSQPRLLRSIDGLNWQPFAADLGDLGIPIGFAIIDARFVVAIDTLNSWERDLDDPEGRFDVRFFESDDGDAWKPSERYRSIDGNGFPYPVRITRDSVLVPARRFVAEPANDSLVRYLEGVVEPDVARRVCGVEVDLTTNGSTAALTNCDGDVLAEVSAGEAPNLFRFDQGIEECVEILREEGRAREKVEVVPVAGDPVMIDSEIDYSPFGWFDGTTYLAPIGDSFATQSGCLDRSTADRRSIFRWTATGGADRVVLPEPPPDFFRSLYGISGTDDGRVAMMGRSGFMQAAPPFDRWTLTELPRRIDPLGMQWSIAPDGSVLLGSEQNRWVFVDLDGEVLRELTVAGNEFPQLLLVANDTAFVQSQGSSARLIALPLNETS